MEEKQNNQQVIDEIKAKLAFYEGIYHFDSPIVAEINDCNKFDVWHIAINAETGGVVLRLYSEVTREFFATADYRIVNLQEISDSIPAPKNLIVQAMFMDENGVDNHGCMDLYEETCKPDLSESQVLRKLQTAFPNFDWEDDDEFQWTAHPDKDHKENYILAWYGD